MCRPFKTQEKRFCRSKQQERGHQADSSLLPPISGEVEAIEVHHFGPRRHEVGHAFLLRVGGAIGFGKGAQLGV